jgi:hypothetical protein
MAHVLSAPIPVTGVSLTIKKGMLVAEEQFEYWLTADSDTPSHASLLSTSGYPIPNSTVSEFGICTASNLKREKGNRRLYKVTATFSNEVEDSSGGSHTTNPETWVPRRETHLEPYQEVEFKDKDGKAYTNGARVPFGSAPAVDKDNIRWDFFQFEPISVTDEIVADRNNTINSVAGYKGRGKHTLLLKVRRSVVGTYYGVLRRLTEYSLIWKESNWHEKLANVGNSFRKDGTVWPYRYRVLNADGSFNATESQVIHTGPLGSADVPYNTAFTDADGEPSGGTVTVNGQVYALQPPDNTLYFIERRRFNEADFASFLRI